MAETAANTYATTGANAAAGTPNQVAVDVDTAGFERQVVQLGDKTSNNASIHPATFLRVTDEPRQLFYDPFDAALDTTNLWNTPTVGNSAVLASVTAGTMSMGTGTTASGWSKLTSQPTFKLMVPSWLGYSSVIALPDGAAPTANAYRFWGSGTIPTTPTTAAPLTDAVGFELSTAGKLFAVVYAAGVRTAVQDLSSSGNNKQPLDANNHRYIIYVRTDKVYWYIDGLDGASLVATSNFQSPAIQTLTATMLAVGGSTPPVSNTQIQCSGTAVWDEGKNSSQISDGTYPWRKAVVSASGAFTMSLTPNGTSGGWLPYFANALVAPAGAVAISAVAGRFGGYMLQNLNTTPAYLQVFDLTAAVTLGTTTPTFVIPIPANATAANGLAANVEFTVGINLANGLKVAATTTATGSTAVSTGLTGVILYK